MRVALDARVATDHFPGIGRVAVQLSAALARLLPEGDLLSLQSPDRPRTRLGPPAGTAVPCPASPFSLAQQWQVPRCLRAAGADVYHSLYFGMPVRPGVPTVWTCQDLTPLVVPGLMDPLRRGVFEALHRLAARGATRIVTGSEATRRDMAERLGIAGSRVSVVPWGVDERFRGVARGLDPALATRLGLPGRYLLYVGINKPHKNLPRLIEAVAAAQAERAERDLRLVVAGAWDPRYPAARDAAARSGLGARVQFLGPVADADLPGLYAGALAFVFPSLYEGFGLPVLEALAAGTPTVASDASSLPEITGDAALLVPPRDVDALAGAIGRLVDSPALRLELSQRARSRAAAFTWERTAGHMLEIYRATARPAPRRAPRGGRAA